MEKFKYGPLIWNCFTEDDESGNYYWNGSSTLTWAQFCLYLMFNWDDHEVENILEGECTSKYNLLLILKEIYNKKININPIDSPNLNKCLSGGRKTLPLREQIIALKNFYNIYNQNQIK